MTPEREAELFAKLDLMLELHRRTEADIREMRADIREMRADVGGMRAEAAETNSRLSRVEGRIEEQSKFLQLTLASRQSRKPAA